MPTARTTLDESKGRGKRGRKNDEDPFDQEAGAPETEERDDGDEGEESGGSAEPESDADGQLVLIDTSHPADKDFEKLAKKIKAEDKARGEHQAKADELRAELLELMHLHNVRHWAKGDFEVVIKPKEERVSVKLRERDNDD